MSSDSRFSDLGEAVVIDVETTGLDKDSDRIISIAALRVDMSAIQPGQDAAVDYFTADLDPGIPIEADATAVHGVTDDDVKGRDSFADIADSLREFIGDRPLVGHNVAFDKRFLQNEFKRNNGASIWKNKPYCTQKRAGYYFWRTKSGAKKPSLDQTLKVFDIQGREGTHHGAYEDALLTLNLAAKLKQMDELPGDAGERWRQMFGHQRGAQQSVKKARHAPNGGTNEPNPAMGWVIKIALFIVVASTIAFFSF